MTDFAPAAVVATRPSATFAWAWVAGLATAAAGGLHLAAAADHRAAGNLVVGFFLLTALAQFGLATALPMASWHSRAPGGRGLAAGWIAMGIAGTVALVALYVVVHSSDLLAGFIGHDPTAAAGHDHSTAGPGHPIETDGPISLSGSPETAGEPVTALGTITVAVELVSVAAFAALLPRSWRSTTMNALLLLGGSAWVLWLAGVLG
jgi:hypothetical protein